MNSKPIHTYMEVRATTMPSLDLVIGMLEVCLAGASSRDALKTLKGLEALEEGLDFHDCPELARIFFRAYEYCRRLVAKNEFDKAYNSLHLLHDAWCEAKRRRDL